MEWKFTPGGENQGQEARPSLIQSASYGSFAQTAQAAGWVVDPRSQLERSIRILGSRCLLLPAGDVTRSLLAIVSSRIGQAPELRVDWFRALRASCRRAANACLLVSPGTAAAPFVQQAARLFGTRCLTLQLPEGDETWEQWQGRVMFELTQDSVRAKACGGESACFQKGYLSPLLDGTEVEATGREPAGLGASREPPLADRALMALADRVVALHVRRGGHVDTLLRKRLADGAESHGTIRIALGRDLVPPRLRDDLLAEGAIGWALLRRTRSPTKTLCRSTRAGRSGTHTHSATKRIVGLEEFTDVAEFVTHCTRRRVGPWPGQSYEDFLDDLILGKEDADHSPLATLRRILSQRAIRASSQGIRGGIPVVCFTEVPLTQLQRLRVFRPHRSRWDFEPYGICLRKAALRKYGGRPVVYDESGSWANVDAGRRPFWQKKSSVTATGLVIDWTTEQEWRCEGAVQLDSFAPDDVHVFVTSFHEAHLLLPSCPYRIVVVRTS